MTTEEVLGENPFEVKGGRSKDGYGIRSVSRCRFVIPNGLGSQSVTWNITPPRRSPSRNVQPPVCKSTGVSV